MKQSLDADTFASRLDLSSATRDRLVAYIDLLRFWQRRINLVAASTLTDPWRRHILDSAQLVRWLPADTGVVVDLGSGAGFPGLVLAIVAERPVTLVESDGRKAAFLLEATRLTAAPARVVNARIESLRDLRADVITARACAPLPRLLAYAQPLLVKDGCCLLLKGGSVADELTQVGETWRMRVERFPSLADAHGCVLRVSHLERQDGR